MRAAETEKYFCAAGAGSVRFLYILRQFSMASEPIPGLAERVQGFVSENRKAILIGSAAAAIVIGGAVYYASTSSARPGTLGDVEKADKKERKKGSKTGKKKKTVKDPDGPILEERSPKVETEPGAYHEPVQRLADPNVCTLRGSKSDGGADCRHVR